MGWFLVNILLPATVPMIFMKLASLVPTLPTSVAARTKLLLLIQNGQLGWLALGFSASSAYELFARIQSSEVFSTLWMQMALATALVILVLSGFMAALGTLFPIDDALPIPTNPSAWFRRYRLLVITASTAIIAATLRCFVHYHLLSL